MPLTPTLIDLPVRGDDRGSLVAVEDAAIGFPIRRAYYIYGTQPGVARGFHAHRDLNQVAVAVAGSCAFVLDDGTDRARVVLDRPDRGLAIGSMTWREMHDFSPDCVLLVLASRPYDDADYIRDYDQFRKLAAASAAR